MDTSEDLIFQLYKSAVDEDWSGFRAQALTRLCERFGASHGAWWTRGVGSDRGELVQIPQPHITVEALAALRFPHDPETPGKGTTLDLPMRTTVGLALHYLHRDGALTSTVLMQFPGQQKATGTAEISRVLAHMIEAAGIGLRQLIRRDDWLFAMGRANRGSAAMVDADGSIFAASERFRELLGYTPTQPLIKLPFALPESVLGDEGGSFTHGPVTMRVTRSGQLYVVYLRKPLPLDSLSPREQEIARALANGKTLKSIAAHYGIAVSTVANHTTRIYRKLSIYRREDLIQLVRVRGHGGRKD